MLTSAFAPLLVVADTVAFPPAGGSDGAVYRPPDVIDPALAAHFTSGESFTTFAFNCTLEPATMLAGAPSIVTPGAVDSPTSIDTVATAGLSGNWLFGSEAENVNESGPV